MKKPSTLLKPILITLFLLTFVGCQRSRGEFWEDAKTAQHHMGRGVRSFFGQSSDDSREIASYQDFAGPSEYEFIPLDSSDLSSHSSSGAIAQSKESPGDPSSSIPSIDSFANPQLGSESEAFNHIRFRYNDFAIDNSENLATVRRIAEFMKTHPKLFVFVEGHCDERGSAAYNLSLGSRRSNSVRTMLIKEGVDLDRLFTVSYGKEKPLDISNSESGWQKNRRAQFRLYYNR